MAICPSCSGQNSSGDRKDRVTGPAVVLSTGQAISFATDEQAQAYARRLGDAKLVVPAGETAAY